MLVKNIAGSIVDVKELKQVNTPQGETDKIEFILKADSNSFECIAFGPIAKAIYHASPNYKVAKISGELSNNKKVTVNECVLSV